MILKRYSIGYVENRRSDTTTDDNSMSWEMKTIVDFLNNPMLKSHPKFIREFNVVCLKENHKKFDEVLKYNIEFCRNISVEEFVRMYKISNL